ncbi:MAG: hypothetical protein HYX82_02930 [Chloroflexi bacterium]|nr:hypothetical protein [Chloroflexota bacterium]
MASAVQLLEAVIDYAEPEIRSAVVQRFEQTVDGNASAGEVCICFNNSIAGLIGLAPLIHKPRKETIRQICRIVEKKRPYPTLLYAKLVEAYLDDPPTVIKGLNKILVDKIELPERIRSVVTADGYKAGFRPNMRVLVQGYTTTTTYALFGLPPQVKKTIKIYASEQFRRGQSEGALLKKRLEEDPDLKVKVLTDDEAVRRLKDCVIDMLIIGTKVIGVVDDDLKVVNTYTDTDEQYPSLAKKSGIKIVVIAGKYKIWPSDLFHVEFEKISDASEKEKPTEFVIPGDWIHAVLTGEGIFSVSGFIHRYKELLYGDLDNFPGWFSEKMRPKQMLKHQERSSIMRKKPEQPVVEMGDDKAAFGEARKRFDSLLEDEEWYAKNAGKHVAIVGETVIVKSDLTELAREVYSEYRGQGVFISPIVRGPLVAHLMSPLDFKGSMYS